MNTPREEAELQAAAAMSETNPRSTEVVMAIGVHKVGSFWTKIAVDNYGSLATYEHRMPHGVLVLTLYMSSSNGSPASSMVFVPAAPHPGQERP